MKFISRFNPIEIGFPKHFGHLGPCLLLNLMNLGLGLLPFGVNLGSDLSVDLNIDLGTDLGCGFGR